MTPTSPNPSGPNPSAPSDTRTDPEPPRAGRPRSTKVLIGLVVALVVALAGAVAMIVVDRTSPGDPLGAIPGIRHVFPESLKDVATRMTDEGAEVEARGQSTEDFRAWVDRYADPGCAAILTGFVDAFGDMADTTTTTSATEPTRIESVTEDGDRGTVVTRTGASAPETTHWVRIDGRWRFTCKGMFGN